jgi:putative sigma-54 modulation protein
MSRKSKAEEFVQEGYSIAITGRNVQVTDSMKNYALEKIEKVEKFSDRIIEVIITMDIQKLTHRVDIVMKVDHIRIRGSADSDNMYASIDKAVDKITSQLRRYHTKIRDHQAKSSKTIDMNVNVIRSPVEEELLDFNADIEEKNNRANSFIPHEIVMKETRPLKILTPEEAIMKMELSGDTFLIFRSENDMKLKVIYRRNDGNFGVIEPES